MRILIATPLYPPDIAPSALYVKELALRLSNNHDVTILAYGDVPEHISGVRIVTISKRAHLFIRMLRFTKELFRNACHADVLIIENGPSVEVPFILTGLFIHKKKVFSVSDVIAKARAHDSFFYRIPHFLAKYIAHIQNDATNFPFPRPEIHPFKSYPEQEFDAYEASWKKYITLIESQFV